ncbi:MAG: hypothetical protein JO283_04820 [Bradyrhizobium sp.]|nr:hypothetical protein [Bradyrhizobium sp.]
MKTLLSFGALALAISATTMSADAKGCLTGAAAGAVAGHYAGHHAIVGAIAGCYAGHHIVKRRQQPSGEKAPQTPAPPPQ